jgi:hypothetical protein
LGRFVGYSLGVESFLLHTPISLTERTGSTEAKVQLRGSLVALAATLVLNLLFVESFLRVFPHVAVSASQHRELAWRKAHKTAEEILTRKHYSFDTYSPELGWELKPNLRLTAHVLAEKIRNVLPTSQ